MIIVQTGTKHVGEIKLNVTSLMAASLGKKKEQWYNLAGVSDKSHKPELHISFYYHEMKQESEK